MVLILKNVGRAVCKHLAMVGIAAACFMVPAHAQGGKAQAEILRQAELSMRAAENAKKLQKLTPKAIVPASVPLDPSNVWNLRLSNGGVVRIQLRPDVAPRHVERIKLLTGQGFYDGLKFHRVIDGFMAQGGDPRNDGSGGSTEPDLRAEFNDLPHVRGTVSMARADSPDSANSQFFIMFYPRLQLDRHYTVFGRVIEGMQYVDAIEKGEPPANPTAIVKASFEG
jgi:cyclophilin family peptidyl-prolyl cis-trans isomerase